MRCANFQKGPLRISKGIGRLVIDGEGVVAPEMPRGRQLRQLSAQCSGDYRLSEMAAPTMRVACTIR